MNKSVGITISEHKIVTTKEKEAEQFVSIVKQLNHYIGGVPITLDAAGETHFKTKPLLILVT